MPTCKLCKNQVKKLVKSHIIPKSMYGFRHLGWDKSPTKLVPISEDLKKEKPKRIPVGIYDRILCNECESIMSRLDDYAYNILYQKEKIPIPNKIKIHGLIIKNVDIKKLILFFSSLILRMHYSSNTAFNSVNLGRYEIDFEHAILNNDIEYIPGVDGFVIFYDNPLSAAFMNPHKTRIFNIMHYTISVYNYKFDIKVTPKEKYPNTIKLVNIRSLSNIGDMVLLKRNLYEEKDFQLIVRAIRGGLSV